MAATKSDDVASNLAADEECVYWTENPDHAGAPSHTFRLFQAPKEGGAREE